MAFTARFQTLAAGAMAWLIPAFARLITAVRPVWAGLDPRTQSQRIYFANHASHGDFILIWTVLPEALRAVARPVAGAEYWQGSALKRFIGGQVFKAVLVARGGSEADPLAPMQAALAEGASLILFPEGTRNLTEAPLLPFKSGLWRLAQSNPTLDLVPVWVENLNRVLPKGAFIPVPLMCEVIFGTPLRAEAGEDKAAFAARAEAALLALKPQREAL